MGKIHTAKQFWKTTLRLDKNTLLISQSKSDVARTILIARSGTLPNELNCKKTQNGRESVSYFLRVANARFRFSILVLFLSDIGLSNGCNDF